MSKYEPGVKLNYLTILKIIKQTGAQPKVLCRCDCGVEKEFYLSNICPKKTARYTKSCGCKRAQMVGEKTSTHGLSGTKFYRHWRSMAERTTLKTYINHEAYKDIKVCERWKTFENFRDDMYESWLIHEKAHGGRNTTLDRIDVNGSYSKENCRWATQAEQGLNKKNTLLVTYGDKTLPLKTLCDTLGKSYSRVYHRIKKGFTLERALFAEPWKKTY